MDISTHFDDPDKISALRGDLQNTILPGVELMGAGYDVYGAFASIDSVKTAKIFDWSQATELSTVRFFDTDYQCPKILTANSASGGGLDVITGDSLSTYQSKLAVSVDISGSYDFFSGSLSVDFNDVQTSDSSNWFSKATQTISLWSITLSFIPSENSAIRVLLDESFKNNLDSLDPSDQQSCYTFFDTYGSCILTGVVKGGSASRTSSTDKTSFTSDTEFNAAARASFNAAAQLSASVSVDDQTKIHNFESTSAVETSWKGGDPALGSSIFLGSGGSGGQTSPYSQWATSVINEPAFVNFAGSTPLTPIWYLCDPAKAGQADGLQKQYASWAEAKARGVTYIDALQVINGDNENISAPGGYQKYPLDLNAGVHGAWLFLCYHQSTAGDGNNPEAITDIKVLISSDDKTDDCVPPDGYHMDPTDLNSKAGGRFVYLCYRTQPYDPETAIKELQVIGFTNATINPPYGFQQVDGDLNAGAGGQWIYIFYRI